MKPYIGITDFTTYEQVRAMECVFNSSLKPGVDRLLHVGVMMSYKTLHNIPTRWASAFPPKEKIAGIFSSPDLYNCIHFADYDSNPDLWRSLYTALSYCGIWIRALQLDMTWPAPEQIANGVHTSRKCIEVILQIGKQALEEIGNDPEVLAEKLSDYRLVINRVLLDKSMGQGKGMDAQELLEYVRVIRKYFPGLGIGVAGGLGPDSIELVRPIISEFPDVSIDAQGRLRPSGSALDPIDWSMASLYIEKASQLFG